MTSYFTFDVNGRHSGLIRRTETTTELTLERMDTAGTWVDDPQIARHFEEPSLDLVPIGEPAARELAASYGGHL